MHTKIIQEETGGFLPLLFFEFALGGDWDMSYDIITQRLNVEPTKLWRMPKFSYNSFSQEAVARIKKSKDLVLSSWVYRFAPKSYISLKEAFDEILDKFYIKRHIVNTLRLDDIIWSTSIRITIYFTNFGKLGFVEPILDIPVATSRNLAEMQTSVSFYTYPIAKLKSYAKGYAIDGWRVDDNDYSVKYKAWNVIKKRL